MSRFYILDSNAVNDFLDACRPAFVARLAAARQRGAKVGTCPPILGEFYYGLELSRSRDENLERARIGLARLKVWPYAVEAAREYGRLAAHLRRTGRPMQVPDIQLAAVALTLGDCTVVSTDSDLRAVPGLSIEDWTA